MCATPTPVVSGRHLFLEALQLLAHPRSGHHGGHPGLGPHSPPTWFLIAGIPLFCTDIRGMATCLGPMGQSLDLEVKDHKRRGANGISVASGCSHSGQAGEGSASRLPLSALQCRIKSSASKRQREPG